MTRNLVLLLVVFVDRSESDSQRVRRLIMRKTSAKNNSVKRIRISDETRRAYKDRDRSSDKDPDAPPMPPEYWEGAVIGKYYQPLKTQISFRIDNEVLDWLKSKGDRHLSRINEILREQMTRQRQHR